MSKRDVVVKVINARGLSWKESSPSKSHHIYLVLEVGDVVHRTEQRKVRLLTKINSYNYLIKFS